MKTIKNIPLAVMLAAALGLASCNNKQDSAGEAGTINTEMDSVSPIGSDGLGREVDTVRQIHTETNQPIDEGKVEP